MIRRSTRLRTVAAGAAVALAGTVAAALPAAAVPSNGLVIDEVYGGGGNSGASYTRDFVELQNRGTEPVDLTGWSIQYHSGSATGSWQVTPLTGTVAPGGYLVVAEAQGAGGTTEVPAQVTGSIAMSASSGTVALVAATTPLTCTDSASCVTASTDLVGYGSAAIAEGTPVGGASNTQSVGRGTAPDTDVNATDLAAGAPTPGAVNAGSTPPPTPPEPGPVRIHDLQGPGFRSPLVGQAVTDVPGVVTAVRATGSSRGFFLQDPTPDADPATSEGVFVYTSAPAVSVGDSVLVSGRISEYYPDAAPADAQTLSVTEITGPTVTVLAHGAALPAPEVVTPTTVPDVYAPDLGGGNLEDTPVTPSRSALDFWESREGMRVQVDDARVVGPSNQYGEQWITTKPAQKPSYRGGTLLTGENATPSGRIQLVPLVDGPDVAVGDVYAGATVGPVDYSQYGGYLIAATQLGAVVRGGLVPTVVRAASARELTVATYNVENLDPTDPPAKFAALARGIVVNLAAPDIVALEEVQDDDGAADDGVVTAGKTLTALTDAVVAAGGPRYSWREIDPVDDQDGGEPGGNIRTVFLFDPHRVSFVDRGAAGVDRSTTATQVAGSAGRPALTLSPGRIDPTNAAWSSSRKPLVGEFRFGGRTVFVVANHWNSKGGDGNADGRFQFPVRSSETQRQQQAALVHAFVVAILKKNPLAQTVVLGDLNDFQFSPALSVLRTGRADGRGVPVLVDMIQTLPANQRYTYVYNGVSQVLDHILLTPGTFLQGRVGYQVAHINSEFPDQTSDHDPQVVSLFGAFR
ncbi:lamin tail domain-containing protein [Nakamurella endophytica]|uniref:Endonuclease n=1 Tax=Nakamurella endophytica TaxID=1748367 RepID=A0A917SW40_9ACTN|nr:lamin tail domain-containing protein [Nakamurella endophytica]GGL98986.1 endonuclease [Nakamurella endophytica]